MSKLREQMEMDMDIKGYSQKTKKSYINHVKNYAIHYNESPDKLGVKEIKEYLHYLITEKNVSKSYVNQVYSGLRFFYETSLQRTWDIKQIPRVKKIKKLPVILTQSEVSEILKCTLNLKHKVMLMTVYGAGLRVSEVTNLRVEDIDSKNMKIRVQNGKGNKDRFTLLSNANLKALRNYCYVYGIRSDWLFPGADRDKPLTTRSVQRVFQKSRNKANINKKATVHTLRHCFASHLIEAGINVYHIQHLLGHSNIRTTSIYIHLTNQDFLNTKSPLDIMENV